MQPKLEPCQIYAAYCIGTLALSASVFLILLIVGTIADAIRKTMKGGEE
jgi:hypothetical protein